MAALKNQGIVAACSSKRKEFFKERRGSQLLPRYTAALALYCTHTNMRTHIDVHKVFKFELK